MRLRRSDPGAPGYGRRRRGRGATFVDLHGRPVTDPDEVARIRALAIPPAWRDVWICPDPRGHIQATGVDAAGRKQYLYHPAWRAKRDAAKFDHVLEVAEHLPRLRKRVDADLAGRGLRRKRVLAAVARLLDTGAFRIGGDEYAASEEPSYGVATLRPDHLSARNGCVLVEYVAKGGVRRAEEISEPRVCAILRDLSATRPGCAPRTPRASYVDPRVVDLYLDGVTVPLPRPRLRSFRLRGAMRWRTRNGRGRSDRDVAERAVLRLLRDET